MAQLVGCLTYNPRVVGSIPGDADCFMWDNIFRQDVNLDCAYLQPGVMGTRLLMASSCTVLWLSEETETDNVCEKILRPSPGCKCKVE